MAFVDDVITKLKSLSTPEQLAGMARFGIAIEDRFGVSVPDMRKTAKELGKDHALALSLWKTGIAEARIVAAMIDIPDNVTEQQMEDWVKDFNSWDVCDQVCDNLFQKTSLVLKKINDWSNREEEFVKRAAFALVACLAWHDKKANDDKFIDFLQMIMRGATDERNFVKKAVNWALRNIGKRNLNLNKAAIKTAREIHKLDSKAARWIASDAIRELENKGARMRFKRINHNK